MSKIPDDFEFIAKVKKIKFWEIKKCTACRESTGFMIIRGSVYHEPCDCCNTDKCRKSSWGEIAEVFNTETTPKVLEEYQQFWHLD